jgi:hypothetical protein
MPTEGERKILLEVQGSVGKAPEVRKAIYERAKVAATRRVKFNQDKAEALRGGEYFTPGHTPAAAPPIVPSTATPPAAPITQEQYLALPSGTQYTAPDGSRRTKP